MAEKEENNEKGLPLKQEMFLEAGVHIGTKIRTDDMKDYIFKRRDDGLYILDIRQSAERLITAAKIIGKYPPEEVAVVASRVYSSNPANKFAELTGVDIIKGRFIPGTMTNLEYKGFLEPKLLIVCDPKGEREALTESVKNGVPVIAFCDTDNETKFIDFVIPINNKGKRALALAFYILTRELLMSQGKIKTYDEFRYDIGYFEQMIVVDKKKQEDDAEEVEEAVQEETPEETENNGKENKVEPKKSDEKENKPEPVKEEKKEN
ncbi:30S ribosomal protein S2 [Candidatus Micrarchaeota archaeon]|nr:30S ribosomal protein S2 [Candidatus Micrarchaeota archaeon]MBU1886275.1 30S ribosomal protein S2 [Candidatus Micrarchaeota archaeon]